MPPKDSLTVSLSPELSAWIAEKAASGSYPGESALIEAALRSLEEKDRLADGSQPQGATTPVFLQGGGETGALMRAYDWSRSPLGDPVTWIPPLKTLVGVMLGSRQPMFIIFGPDQIILYNDSYAAMCGKRHPHALGKRFRDLWFDIWNTVEPIVTRAYSGQSIHMDDIQFTMHRNGYPEETHFSFSYTPIRDDHGTVVGIFCACTETTQEVKARAAIKDEWVRLRELFRSAPNFMCVLRGPDHVIEIMNDAYGQVVGHNRGLVGKPIREALPEVEGQGFFELLDGVYASGEPFIGRNMSIALQREPAGRVEERVMDFVYQPIVSLDGTTTGIFVSGNDVTERAAAEQQKELLLHEMNHRVKNLFAVASGMVALSARSASTTEEMARSLRGRLNALARANDLISPSFAGADGEAERTTTAEDLVRAVVLPYLEEQRTAGGDSIVLTGPKVVIGGSAVTSLALVLHETTTNSVKHGALSAPEGSVRIEWQVIDEDLHLFWEEHGGPPVTEPRKTAGFGSSLVSRSVTGQLAGTIDHDWRREGLRVGITIPMERLVLLPG